LFARQHQHEGTNTGHGYADDTANKAIVHETYIVDAFTTNYAITGDVFGFRLN